MSMRVSKWMTSALSGVMHSLMPSAQRFSYIILTDPLVFNERARKQDFSATYLRRIIMCA